MGLVRCISHPDSNHADTSTRSLQNPTDAQRPRWPVRPETPQIITGPGDTGYTWLAGVIMAIPTSQRLKVPLHGSLCLLETRLQVRALHYSQVSRRFCRLHRLSDILVIGAHGCRDGAIYSVLT